MRKLMIIGGVVLAVAVGGGLYLFSSLDGLVKTLIEKVGSEVAGVKVSVGGVKLALADGKASITGLALANPPGFSAGPALSLGEIAVTLDSGSVNKNPIVIKEILVGAPMVSYEIGAGGSNLDVLQKNVQAFAAKHQSKTAPAAPAAPAADSSSGTKVVIDHLTITDGQVKLAAGGIPGANLSAKLGTISLSGIGREGGGASPAEVAHKVLDALMNGAIKSAGSLGNTLGAIGDKAKALLPPDVGNAVKGLFGK